ncbi:LuxR C-terminal-related transcriptional regulator, partial [Streptomyces sp. NPDC017405]|uniref:LuxR C-terminal-related transcriptional regulator n=1 Tax=unclassified Streptomyces TaxID=2593676 RepID=UPI0037A35D35
EAGYSTRMIADDLGLSLGTAGHRVEQLLHALVAINRTHAVALGYQYGILGRSRRRPTHPDGGHSLTSQTTALVTDRARDIIEHLAKGHLREEAAHILGLSRPTVTREIAKACSDLKVPNRSTAVVNSAISKGIISLPPCDPVDLSTAQIMDLRLIAAGYRNPEIAALLDIPVDTVRSRVGQIMNLLGAKNRIHMVALGWQRGILGRSRASASAPASSPRSSPSAPPASPGTPAHRPEHTNGDRRL